MTSNNSKVLPGFVPRVAGQSSQSWKKYNTGCTREIYSALELPFLQKGLQDGKPYFECNGSGYGGDMFSAASSMGLDLLWEERVETLLTQVWVSEETLLHVSRDLEDGEERVRCRTWSRDAYEAVCGWWSELKAQTWGSSVYCITSSIHGLNLSLLGVVNAPLVRKNYSECVLQGYDRIMQDLADPCQGGKLALLTGPPGSGKTFLIRGLITEAVGCKFVYVLSSYVEDLGSSQLLPVLLEAKRADPKLPLVILIEDADLALGARNDDNMGPLSTLLNLGDGLLGELLQVYIVATTNATYQGELDPAVTRPGRLSVHLALDLLSQDHANEIYRGLCPTRTYVFEEPCSLASVYTQARKDGWIATTSGKVSNAPKLRTSRLDFVSGGF